MHYALKKYGLKIWFVYAKFKILPFTSNTLKVLFLLGILYFLFNLFNFSFHPILNIVLKAILMVFVYISSIHGFKISKDISTTISKFLNKKPRRG